MTKDLTVDLLAAMMRGEDRTKDYWLASLTNVLMSRSAEAGETLRDRKALSRRIQAAHMWVVDEDLADGGPRCPHDDTPLDPMDDQQYICPECGDEWHADHFAGD